MNRDNKPLVQLRKALLEAYYSSNSIKHVLWMQQAYRENSKREDTKETDLSSLLIDMMNLPESSRHPTQVAFETVVITAINTDKANQGLHLDCAMEYILNAGSTRISSLGSLQKSQEKLSGTPSLNHHGSRQVISRLLMGYMLTESEANLRKHENQIFKLIENTRYEKGLAFIVQEVSRFSSIYPHGYDRLSSRYAEKIQDYQFSNSSVNLLRPDVVNAFLASSTSQEKFVEDTYEGIMHRCFYNSFSGTREQAPSSSILEEIIDRLDTLNNAPSKESSRKIAIKSIIKQMDHDKDIHTSDAFAKKRLLSRVEQDYKTILSLIYCLENKFSGFIAQTAVLLNKREIVSGNKLSQVDSLKEAANFIGPDLMSTPIKSMISAAILCTVPAIELINRFGDTKLVMTNMHIITKNPELLPYSSPERKREVLGEDFGL